MAHVQSSCKATKPARILAHSQCRRQVTVTEAITKHEKGWKVFPGNGVRRYIGNDPTSDWYHGTSIRDTELVSLTRKSKTIGS
eukprot:1575628-Rhodomonas_salina.1